MKRWLSALALCLSAVVAAGQTPDLAGLFEMFRAERAAAAGDAALADRLAARAEAAREAGNLATAARLIRDARWALPAAPPNLPKGVRVIGFNRFRHDDRVNSLRFNRDGTLAISGSNDRTVRVWDVDAGREIQRYTGHAASPVNDDDGVGLPPLRVPDAIFLPDGKTAASADRKQIHLWDLSTGRTIKVLEAQPEGDAPKKKDAKEEKPNVILFKTLAVNDDGTRLAAGSDDKRVRVWELPEGKEIFASLPQSSRLEAVAWQPKGRFVAAVDADGVLCIYDPSGENRNPIMKVQVTDGGGNQALAVAFSPDGTRILTGGVDGAPRLIPAPGSDGAAPPKLAGAVQKLRAMPGTVQGVAVTPDSAHFVAAGPDASRLRGTVQVVDALGQVVRSFSAPGSLTAVAIRPDSLQIAAASEDGGIYFWNFQPTDDHRSAADASEPLWATAVNPKGTLVAAAGADKTIRIYTAAGKLVHTLPGSGAAVTALAWLNDDTLLSAGGDKLLRAWDVKAGKAAGEWPGHAAAVLALAAAPDGSLAVSGSADKTVHGWNVKTGKPLWTWTAQSAVAAVAVSPNGKRAVVGGADGGLSVLAIDGAEVKLAGYVNAHVSGVGALAFNSDGTRLASVGGDGLVKVWTIPEHGTPAQGPRLGGGTADAAAEQPLSAVAFSPDGTRIAAAGADRAIRLYDAARGGAELRVLRGCTDWVTSLAFLPDGDSLAAASADAALRIFELAAVETGTRSGHHALARTLVIGPQGTLASVGDDRAIRLWNPATGAEIAEIAAPDQKLYAVAFLDNERIAAGGSEGKLRLWNLADRTEAAWPFDNRPVIETGPVYALAAAADRSRFAVWSPVNKVNGKYALHEPTGRLITAIQDVDRSITCICFSRDLQRLATADDTGRIALWNTAAPDKPESEPWPAGDAPLVDIGFAPDARRILAVDDAGRLLVIDAEARKVLSTTPGPAAANALLAAPAGDRVVIFGNDGDTRFFDFNGKELAKLQLPSPANGGCFSPDGKTLYTANSDGSLYVIDVP